MAVLNWILISGIAGLATYQIISLNKVHRQASNTASILNDLSFKQKDSAEFIRIQAARIHYDLLKRRGELAFYPEMPLQEALKKPGVREFLTRQKVIRKKDKEPFKETLAERTRKLQISLEPLLIALSDLEN